MTARWTAFALWAAVAASLVFWGLKLFVPGTPAPAHAALASSTATPRGDLSRLLGVDAVVAVAEAPPPPSRFHLIGVVAPRSAAAAGEGVALIAVDDKPARAYRVGALIDGSTVLQAVRPRGAALGPRGGAADVTLDLAPPAPAATGALPTANAGGNAGAVPAPAPVPGFGMRPGQMVRQPPQGTPRIQQQNQPPQASDAPEPAPVTGRNNLLPVQ